MDAHEQDEQATPPTSQAEMDFVDEPPQTRWPRVIGVISLIYAIGGLLCQVGAMVGSLLSEWFMQMGGMDIEVSPVIKYGGAVSSVLGFCVGLVLLFGAINLLRRRPSGVRLLKTWAMLRIVLLVVGIGMAIVMLPANIEFQRAMIEASNERMRESGRPDMVQEFDEDKQWTQTVISSGVWTAVLAVYPVFIVFFLSRKKIDQEIEQWD